MCPHPTTCNRGQNCDCEHRQRATPHQRFDPVDWLHTSPAVYEVDPERAAATGRAMRVKDRIGDFLLLVAEIAVIAIVLWVATK